MGKESNTNMCRYGNLIDNAQFNFVFRQFFRINNLDNPSSNFTRKSSYVVWDITNVLATTSITECL